MSKQPEKAPVQMPALQKALKAALVELQKEGKLPANMTELNTVVFDEALRPIEETLQALHASCHEAITGEWAIDVKGLESMKDTIEEHVEIDWDEDTYSEDDDDNDDDSDS